jgi:hypothetical protein
VAELVREDGGDLVVRGLLEQRVEEDDALELEEAVPARGSVGRFTGFGRAF